MSVLCLVLPLLSLPSQGPQLTAFVGRPKAKRRKRNQLQAMGERFFFLQTTTDSLSLCDFRSSAQGDHPGFKQEDETKFLGLRTLLLDACYPESQPPDPDDRERMFSDNLGILNFRGSSLSGMQLFSLLYVLYLNLLLNKSSTPTVVWMANQDEPVDERGSEHSILRKTLAENSPFSETNLSVGFSTDRDVPLGVSSVLDEDRGRVVADIEQGRKLRYP
ncbi:hypothetical protein SO802_014018 [Lithocarpus litseifolius]|uniref:Uncharacterized protein n=1 Tax=Lithocarpus litseifolius TaxID=425828 RepID=A0AAW2D777_9ROSI